MVDALRLLAQARAGSLLSSFEWPPRQLIQAGKRIALFRLTKTGRLSLGNFSFRIGEVDSRFVRPAAAMELGRADDFDNAVLRQVKVDPRVSQDFTDEGGTAGFGEFQMLLCRQSDRDVFLRFVRGCASGTRS